MSTGRLSSPIPSVPGLDAALARVDREMRRWTVVADVPLLSQAIAQIFVSRGKQVRAALTMAMAAANGADVTEKVVTAAAAVELVHLGSLVHDDMMDNATERRGIRTVNADFGENTALMVGDFVLTRASQAVLSVSRDIADELADAFIELTCGQTLEMMDAYNLDRTEEQAMRSVALKTGALFRAACTIGAMCAGATPDDATTAARYGEHLGQAFQVLDDLLDLASTAELFGKPVGTDLRQGVYTLPLLRAMANGHLPHVRSLLVQRRERLTQEEAFGVMRELRETDFVEATFAFAQTLVHEAVKAISHAPGNDAWHVLRQFPGDYLEWTRSMVAPA